MHYLLIDVFSVEEILDLASYFMFTKNKIFKSVFRMHIYGKISFLIF